MPLVSHKRSQNAGVFTLEDDDMAFVAELTAVVDGLTKISFTFPSNYSLAIESIGLWYRRHFGISPLRKAVFAVAATTQSALLIAVGWLVNARHFLRARSMGEFAGLQYVTSLPAARYSSGATHWYAARR